MAKKTISNTFTVNTVDDGESAFDVTLDNQIAGVECDKNGNIVGDINIPFRIFAHYGSNDVIDACTITDNHEDVDSDIDVSYSQQQIGLVTLYLNDGNALRDTNVIAFTVVHPQYGTRVVSFTLKRIINGESAPFYNDEWYAWSNDSSAASVTTEPTISGSWSHSIPNQGGLAYLWKKIIRYNYNASTKQYVASTAQYYRMSGTNGTSIHTRGEVANASSRTSDGHATIITDSGTQTITMADGDAVTQLDDGHLYQWVTEGGGKWLDLGQFKGESGVTYYTHIAWATGVTLIPSPSTKPAGQQNIPNATSVQGGVIVPSGAGLPWMGYLIDTNVSDSTTFTNYTWSETKGAKGDDAITYEVMCSLENITIPSGETSKSATTSFDFFSKEGSSPKQVFYTYWSLYKRGNDGTMTFLFAAPTKSSYARNLSLPATTSESAFVMYIWGDNGYSGNNPESQPYLAKAEVAVLKDGDAAVVYKIDFEKNTFAHNLNTNKLAISVQGTVYKIEGATSTPVALTNGNFRLYKVIQTNAGETQVRILPTLSNSVFSYTSDTDFNNETLLKAQLTIDSSVVATECIQIVTSGERGKVGRFYYYSGFDWDATNNTDTFVVNDAQVPYFSKAGGNANGYYVFNREETPSGGEMTMAQMAAETTVEGVIQWNEAPWEVMTNDFKYLITKAIFGDYAEFGSFIINGVWLFSKWGQWLGNTVINGKVNYYNFNNGSISYISNSPIYAYVNSSDPSQSTISIHNDTTPRTGDTIYYPYTEGVYLALSRGTMYYLRLRCVRCKVYLCYENYEVELQQFPTAQQEGGLVIDSDSYYIGSWLFQVQQSGNYLIKVVRDDSSASYKPSNTVAWLEVSAKYFRPNFAVNGENGKTAVKDMSADGAFSGSGNFTHAYSQGYSVGNYLSVGQSTKFDISSSGGNSKKYIYVDENGYLRVSTSERPIGGF